MDKTELDGYIQRMRENDTTLQELYLRDNNIGDEGAKALAEALKENTTLTWLCLWGNDLDEKILKEIGECCIFNKQLKDVRKGFLQLFDAQDKDLSKAQVKALIQLQKTNPNFKVWLSKDDEAESQKLQDETNQNKENAGENQAKQQAKERVAMVARAKGKGQNT